MRNIEYELHATDTNNLVNNQATGSERSDDNSEIQNCFLYKNEFRNDRH